MTQRKNHVASELGNAIGRAVRRHAGLFGLTMPQAIEDIAGELQLAQWAVRALCYHEAQKMREQPALLTRFLAYLDREYQKTVADADRRLQREKASLLGAQWSGPKQSSSTSASSYFVARYAGPERRCGADRRAADRRVGERRHA